MKLQHFSLALLILSHVPLLLLTESTRPPFSCDSTNPSTKTFPFCQTNLPITQRVRDLISRLTLDEKISQLVDSTPPIPRLGIPAYEWWSEALHGVAFIENVSERQGIHFNGTIRAATSFPQVILSAASFDAFLWYRIAQAIGKEARATYNEGQAIGMTFWSPNINIFRDPRWGRGQETPGEDPMVAAKYSVSFVRGIQGDSFEGGKLGADHLQASACCKHFTAYDLDKWNGVNRFVFNAKVTQQDLADTYQPPFQSCVQEGRASGIMCGYNQVNGVPNCANYDLLSETARGKWSFDGYITSDCDAVKIIYTDQGYAKSPEDAVADVLKAGMDVNCGDYLKNYTKSAVEKKKLAVQEIDRALRNLFSVRMRLGLFNGNPAKQLYGDIRADQVCSKEHQALALEAALDGIVLLKNSDKLLPLSPSKVGSLAVIGPNADLPKTLLANYAGPPCKTMTPLQGLKNFVKNTKYHPGCNSVACNSSSIDKAVKIARTVDQVVLVMGLDLTQETEETDRNGLELPGMQQKLIASVAKVAKKPVVLVLLCGGPVDVSFAKDDPKIGSILWAGYPGQAGGTAIAEIIFGRHNPGGRLPMTWYPKDFIKVPMTDMRMRPDPASGYPGRTYRFYTGQPVFEFGYGLSYTNHTYHFLSATPKQLNFKSSSKKMDTNSNTIVSVSEIGTKICERNKFNVTIGVENHGDMASKHPMLLFARHKKVGDGRPIKKLIGFQTVKVNAKEKSEIVYEVNPCEHLSRADEDGVMVIDEGTQFLVVGDQEHEVTFVI